ncbi:GmrSD restriction endonuclease domain-containing protein [Aquipuribacter hungaricus]|uniref:DUF262 domain-containing protein n=1 Tax=Aquipuribacter hungaricus TaxID=545624 RepID=A0ABV7WBM8_9MICO
MSTYSAMERFAEAQRRLVTQASDFSLETVAAMVDTQAIDPSPAYQRRARWSVSKQSALIESFLLNVPVPPVYLAEEEFGYYSVIDGQQRITAVHDFMRGRLELRGLKELPELNNARIDALPEAMRNALRMRPYIRAVTLLRQSDPDLKYEVFIRLNRGGERLTDQEVRNSAMRGPLNDLLIELGSNPFLWQQFNITPSSERFAQMADVEYVLRFLTLLHSWPSFTGDLSPSMDHFMLENAHAGRQGLEQFALEFNSALVRCEEIWGVNAFRRAEQDTWRGRGLLGMYDAEMLSVALLSEAEVNKAAARSDNVLRMTNNLFDDPEFVKAVTVSTNTSARLRFRVEALMHLLRNA